MLNHINYTQAIVHTESIHLSLKDLGFYSLDEFLLYLQKESLGKQICEIA